MRKQLLTLAILPALLLASCGKMEVSKDKFINSFSKYTEMTTYKTLDITFYTNDEKIEQLTLKYDEAEEGYDIDSEMDTMTAIILAGTLIIYMGFSFPTINQLKKDERKDFFNEFPEDTKYYLNPHALEYSTSQGTEKYTWNNDGMLSEYVTETIDKEGNKEVGAIKYSGSGKKYKVPVNVE